jgi:hypothetical protein
MKKRSPKIQRVTSPKLKTWLTTSMVDPDSYESRRKQKLNAQEVMTVSHTTHELQEVTESVTDHLPPIPV